MRFKIPSKQPSSFRASALYLSGNTAKLTPDRVEWSEGRNLQTTNPEAAAAIMDATAARSTRCRTPAYHFILAFDPNDAKAGKLSPETMREIVDEAIERLGLNEYQSLIYAHKDTDHPHLHFLVNRIHPKTGKAYSRHEDGKRMTALVRGIAKERGLNIAKERARLSEKELVEDFDDIGPNVADQEYWLAKREERTPLSKMDKAQVKALREKVGVHFYNSASWADLSDRLGAHGLELRRKGQGLILVKGNAAAKLSQMGKAARLTHLEKKFNQTFDDFALTRIAELRAEEHKARRLPDEDALSPSERRRAERLRAAERKVAEKQADPVMELDRAHASVRYWRGIEAHFRFGERRVRYAEKNVEYARGRMARSMTWEERHRARFKESLQTAFRNPKKAERIWAKLEGQFGIEEAADILKQKPSLAGGLKGAIKGKHKDDLRKEAEKALRYLKHRRTKWRDAQ